MKTLHKTSLEKTTADFIKALNAKKAPPLYTLSPEEARKVLEGLQKGEKKQSKVHNIKGPKGDITLNIFHPHQDSKNTKAIVYFHGGGWILGSVATHERFMNDLASTIGWSVVFVNYTPSPEAQFPLPIEECYSATQYVAEHSEELGLLNPKIVVAGDSVGGNMAIDVTLMAKERKGPKIAAQVLYYPVTSSELNSESYQQFAEGPWLTKAAMEWFWNAYAPNRDQRNDILLSPVNASIDQLKDLPKALIITAENDVLRDEGEAYAHKLMEAGVDVTAVRMIGTIHDFMMLNGIKDTPSSQSGLALTLNFLNRLK